MNIYNSRTDAVRFCIYEPGDGLRWLSLYPGGTGSASLAAGAEFAWTGAGTRTSVQIVFFIGDRGTVPKVVSTTAATIDGAGNVLNSPPRAASVKDSVHHVVVLMLENRSFDNVLGWLYADAGNRPPRNIPTRALPTFDGLVQQTCWNTNQAAAHDSGTAKRTFASRGVSGDAWFQQPNPNAEEDYPSMLKQLFGTETPGPTTTANMSGFIESYSKANPPNPARIMESFSPEQLPVISQLARAFAVCDRWFASAPCETWPNRSFVHAGTSFGRVNNGDQLYETNDPVPNLTFYGGRRTVFDALDAHRISWKVYHDTLLGPSLVSTQFWTVWQKLTHAAAGFGEFEQAARMGTLPAYSFIEPEFMLDANDAHPGPGCDMRRCEDLLLRVWNAVSRSPKWNNTLLIITYDEHGGCYDHVPPPATATPPDNSPPQFAVPGFSPFRHFGVRVPTVVVSPLIEPGTVFRAPDGGGEYDHTSILATLRDWLFRADSGFLTVPTDWLSSARIAAAPTLWQVLTRTVPRTDLPTIAATRPAATPMAITAPTVVAAGGPGAVGPSNAIQAGLAVEADALGRFDANDRAVVARIDDMTWKKLIDESSEQLFAD